MRFWMSLLIAGFLALPSHAQSPAELVDKAIEATAGKVENLDKFKQTTSMVKGSFFSPGGELPAEREIVAAWPDRFRATFQLTIDGAPRVVALGTSGEARWRKASGVATEDDPTGWNEVAPDIHLHWLTTLLPLKTNEVTLRVADDVKVLGSAAAGVKVAVRGQPDVTLYFDRKSNLLVKAEMTISMSGARVKREVVYSGHKAYEGIQLPGKITEYYDTRKMMEFAAIDYKFPAQVNKEMFLRP